MSVADVSQGRQPGESNNVILKWLPPIILIIAIVGIVLVIPMTTGDSDAREWYRGKVGGSELYRLNVIFGRIVPLLASPWAEGRL